MSTQTRNGSSSIRRVEWEGKCARVVENYDLSGLDLDVAGFEFWIARALVAQDHLAGDCQDVLAATFLGLGMRVRRLLLIHHDLSDAIAVAQIDKSQRAKVAPPRTPAHQGHWPARMFVAQRSA